MCFAQRRKRIRGFAGLRDDQHGRIFACTFGAVYVLAGILDVDGDAAQVFNQQLGNLPGMTAGAACGDDDTTSRIPQPAAHWCKNLRTEYVSLDILCERGG